MRIPASGKIGLALIFVGAAAYAWSAYMMATRSFFPIDVPISLSRGHFTSGIFKINAEGTYTVDVYTVRRSKPGCDMDTMLRARYVVLRAGETQLDRTFTNGWAGNFYAENADYRVVVQVLSDASCLDTAEPRLRVASYSTYRKYADRHAVIVFGLLPLITCGLLLVIRSLTVGRVSRKELIERIISDGPAQYPRYASRSSFPSSRRFSALPAYGLLYGLALALSVIPAALIFGHVWGLYPHSKGVYVRITKPKPSPVFASLRDESITVSLRRNNKSDAIVELRVNSRLVALEDLSRVLRAELSGRADRVVCVEGDMNLPYSDIVWVVDTAHQAWPGVSVVLMTPELRKPLDVESTSKERHPRIKFGDSSVE